MKSFEKRIENYQNLQKESNKIARIVKMIQQAISKDKKIIFCGNGGSASQANHIACEFVAKFQKEREALPAISLCANNSIITAVANDYSFDEIFKRQIEAHGDKEDILIALSTSGKSKNIIKAIKEAKRWNLNTILLTGKNKTRLGVDIELNVPCDTTAEIQEMHLSILHIICEMLEL